MFKRKSWSNGGKKERKPCECVGSYRNAVCTHTLSRCQSDGVDDSRTEQKMPGGERLTLLPDKEGRARHITQLVGGRACVFVCVCAPSIYYAMGTKCPHKYFYDPHEKNS